MGSLRENAYPGKLFIVEGIDGSGKSTQLDLLHKWLGGGGFVLAGRYVYTAFARDGARRLDRAWLRKLYAFAVEPTVAFYFDVPLDEAIARIMEGRPALKYYQAGMDLGA